MDRHATQDAQVTIPSDGAELPGALTVPPGARGMVLFAHGSGSGRFSPRNQRVAQHLHEAGLATLLFDLLTEKESEVDQRTRHLRFDVALLAQRLTGAVDWTNSVSAAAHLKIGLFGASTGAAAALMTAAARPEQVAAVVSRGGRPDLAGEALTRVQAPTLLIVGGNDLPVIGLNQEASLAMQAPNRVKIISGASHLFEEPGKMELVSAMAREWFESHLISNGSIQAAGTGPPEP